MNKNNEFIQEYFSCAEAAKQNNIKNYQSISNCCNGLSKTSAGFKWKWKNE